LARAQAKLHTAAPATTAANDQPAYLLLNHTHSIDGYLHWGRDIVAAFIEARMSQAGYDCFDRVYEVKDCRRVLGRADAARIKLVVFDGEGLVHHDDARVQMLLDLCAEFKRRGARCVLINAMWRGSSAACGDRLGIFDLVVVRESISLSAIKVWRNDARLVPDFAFAAIDPVRSGKSGTAGKLAPAALVVLDHVDRAASRQLAAFARFHGRPFFTLDGPHTESLVDEVGNSYEEDGIAYPRILRSPDELSRFDSCVTGRYHGLIAALCAGVPTIAVGSNTPTIEGMLFDMELSNAALLGEDWLHAGHGLQWQHVQDRLEMWTPLHFDAIERYRQRATRLIDDFLSAVTALAEPR
jgi:hypothetical protein